MRGLFLSNKAKAAGNTVVFSRLLTKLGGNKVVKIVLFLSDISINSIAKREMLIYNRY